MGRRKEHINFDLNTMRDDKKIKIDLSESETTDKILRKYDDETDKQRRERIWKTTARIINKELKNNYPKKLKNSEEILNKQQKEELEKLYKKEDNLKNEIQVITKKQEKERCRDR